MPQSTRKSTQRARLIAGMVEVTNRRGYANANVSSVIGQAGVSRPTFYDYFEDREDCFTATITDVQLQLAGALNDALSERGEESPYLVTARTLVQFSSLEPARARFLMGEAMSGGSRALDVRDRGIAELALAIDQAGERAGKQAVLADIDARVLLGSIYRMIAARLRRGEPAGAKIADQLADWVRFYERPAAERRWKKLRPQPPPEPSPHVPSVPIQQMPSVLPPGRPWIPPEQIAENHRLRILYAAARLAQSKGAQASTVADIVKAARVDGRAFYRLFADKQEAFAAVHELGFQQVMDVTAKAFFSVQGWPERSWEGGRALTQLLQANPLVAHVGFVEAYALGPGAVQRIEDSHTAFLFFLQEGLLQEHADPGPSRVAMEAIIAAVFEIIYMAVRATVKPRIAGMLPYFAHVWLTPFLGLKEADAFIDSRKSKKARASKAAPARRT
jgi:AcrR family transcriptional regulator